MKRNTKIYIFIAIILIAVIILYFVFRKKADKPDLLTTSTTTSGTVVAPFNVSTCNFMLDSSLNWNKTLNKGVNSCESARLQYELNKLSDFPYASLVVDGYFGTNTEAKLKRLKGVTTTTLNSFKGFSL